MSAFPHRRLVPVVALAALDLVLCTAQRGILASVARQGAPIEPADIGAALVAGTRLDLAVVAVLFAPAVAWVTICPERLWCWRPHRIALGVLVVTGIAARVAFLALEAIAFQADGTRLGGGARTALLRAWNESVERHGAPGLAIALAALVLSGAALAALLRPLLEKGWSEPAATVGPRLRELLLVLALGTLAVVTSLPLAQRFPESRILHEISGNGATRIGAAALQRARLIRRA
jgi:hypothetical protein